MEPNLEMEVEVLHAQRGDKKKKIDTGSAAGRKEAETFIKTMLRQGTAIFLERGKKTYRITDYDAKKNHLIVRLEKKGKAVSVGASPAKGRKTAVAPQAGG